MKNTNIETTQKQDKLIITRNNEEEIIKVEAKTIEKDNQKDNELDEITAENNRHGSFTHSQVEAMLDKPVPELDPAEGARFLHIMLIKDLKGKLSPAKLFNVTKEEKEKIEEKKQAMLKKAQKTRDPEEKKKITATANVLRAREAGEYIFESQMLKYFQEDKLQKVLFEATNDRLRHWRENEKDEYVFDATREYDAAMCGFLLGCRDKTKYEAKVIQDSKGENVMLSIKFKSYKKIKEGTQAQVRGAELPNEVVYEREKEEVWREALFEIPPKEESFW